MNASAPDITVIIPNWNGMKWLPGCFTALGEQTYRSFSVTVVDNGSTDGSVEWIRREHPDAAVVTLGRNTGFAHAVNEGIRAAGTPFIVLLNNDTRIRPDWLDRLHSAIAACGEDVAGVCGKMLDMKDPSRIENAGDVLSWQGAAEKRGSGCPAGDFDQPEDLFSCCAGGAIYRRTFFDRAGLFDESFFAYLEDIDLGLRGRMQGYRFRYEPSAVMEHHSHGSGTPTARYVRLTTRNRLALFALNIPRRNLLRRLPSILYGQWYFLVCHHRPVASLLGLIDFFTGLPSIMRKRIKRLDAVSLGPDEIDLLLSDRMIQPGLTRAFLNRLGRGRRT